MLKRFSRSEVKGQGHSEIKYTFAADAYVSTVWHRGLLVCIAFSSCLLFVCYYIDDNSGADPGRSLGSDEPPQRQRKILEAILVRRGLNLVRCNGKKTRKRTPLKVPRLKKAIRFFLGRKTNPHPQYNPGSATATVSYRPIY